MSRNSGEMLPPLLACLVLLGGWAEQVVAQESPAETPPRKILIVPQAQSATVPGVQKTPVAVSKVSAQVQIHNKLAETQLLYQCANSGTQAARAEIALPVSDNVRPLREPTLDPSTVGCEMVPAREALPLWQNYAQRLNHPGPVEFCGQSMLKTDPVELPAGKSQPIIVTYTESLFQHGARCDYILPRSESVRYAVPWEIEVRLQADQPISTVYSPSHPVRTQRMSPETMRVTLDEQAAARPGSFWLTYLLDQGELSATLFTQLDSATPEEADGTFLFLVGLPALPAVGQSIPRELTLALDRSGSMQGQKIEQVRDAAVQILEDLKAGESFNIITYNDRVRSFAEKPVRKTPATLQSAKQFIAQVRPRGGTDLHGALLESVRQEPTPRSLPIVLFLTDGLPTVGETDELKIREGIARQNTFGRRIFTVGVGVDVNTPLLETIANETRAQPAFVLPSENIKTEISRIFGGLENPILADAKLEILNANGEPAPGRWRDVFPSPLPDLFQDDHLVVLGRFEGTEPLLFRLEGNYLGKRRSFEFTFSLKDQPESPFVGRLWATRKIAALVQKIRQSGAQSDPYDILANPKQDPQVKTLAKEILQLTMQYGIVTEYTAFLAEAGNHRLNRREQLNRAYRNFDERAVKTRVGLGSVNQSINNSLLHQQRYLNSANEYWDANMQRVGVPNVQQLRSGAFFLRGNTWVEGPLVNRPRAAAVQVVPLGSPAYENLLKKLVARGEHKPLSLGENVLMKVDRQTLLICPPAAGKTANEINALKRPAER